MTTYTVPLTTYVDTAVRVETDPSDPDVIVELALELVDIGSLCHQCGDVELGDDWECVDTGDGPNVTRLADGVYTVTLTGHANTAVDIATELTAPELIAALAQELLDLSELCSQCADKVTLGDVWKPVLIDGKPTMTRHTP